MSIRAHYSSALLRRLTSPMTVTKAMTGWERAEGNNEDDVVVASTMTKEEDLLHPQNTSSSSASMTLSSSHSHVPSFGVSPLMKQQSRRGNVVRMLGMDLPLLLVFALLVGVWLLRQVYIEYYVPLIDRAVRTDAQLLEEFTYYERQCTEYDLSTRDLTDLLLSSSDDTEDDDDTISTAVAQMLRHGGLVIPQLLSLPTVQSLRQYIVHKNAHIPVNEHYPVSQGRNRLSYGIDAAEHPIVSAAIAEVLSHPVLVPLLAALLGDPDPASAEITAIMNYYGASAQVWHQDTKQDGNAIKFARTYSHSYSLFLPLQDITAGMGATDICPGTHYCANDLVDLCERTQLSLHQVSAPNQTFPAGYGALLNQHVWHRGGAHVDPHAPERILFILSFVARPRFGHDPRQLSRGTYFHQKWNMWGHTVQDLQQAARAMRAPWSILRALSLWKDPASHWGYDLITSGLLRLANEQLEFSEFTDRLLPRLRQWGLPVVMDFDSGEDDSTHREMWTRCLRNTLDRWYQSLLYLCLVAQAIYWWGVLRFLRREGRRRVARRVLLLQGLVVLLGMEVWQTIRHSEWGQSVRSGRALMRPFPQKYASSSSCAITTFPTRHDVLWGTRYDADFLGSYNQWLDYHPGNVLYNEHVRALQTTVQKVPLAWKMDHMRRVVQQQGGRFLQQNWRTGDWCLVTSREEINDALAEDLSGLPPALLTWRNVRRAEWRFGPSRETALARLSLAWLQQWSARLFRSRRPTMENKRLVPTTRPPVFVPQKRTTVPTTRVPKPETAPLTVGSLIWFHSASAEEDEVEDYWVPGVILKVHHGRGSYDVTLDDGAYYEHVPASHVERYRSIQTGDRVLGCFEVGLVDCYPGTIAHVYPGANVRILYDDGDVYDHVPATMYYVPPYAYEGPIPAAP